MTVAGSVKFFAKTFFFALFLVLIVAGGVAYLLFHSDGEKEVTDLIIRRGMSLGQVAHTLHKEQVIAYPEVFKHLLTLTQGSSRVRAGEFRFKKSMRMIDALFVLYNDEPIVHQVTIPEGWTVRQVASILANAKLIDEQKFIGLALSKEGAARFNFSAPTLEGYLFPDTYAFSRVDGEDRIIERMVQRFKQKFANEFAEEIKAKGWTLERVVTMASIIEKETGSKGERELISSVFHNRMKKRMRLQSDPTTIYGIENFNGNLTKADLKRYSPYNTYTIPELPPGAIANPGYDALVSVLRPATTNYLFFVSNNQGGHIFSETYGQHSRLVNDYQKSPVSRQLGRKAAAPKKK